VQLLAGTDKGFVDAADRQEGALLAGELGDIRGEKRCVEAYYLHRTRFESIAERKSRRRRLTADGNVEISRRYLGRVPNEGDAECRMRAMPIARERLNSTPSGHSGRR
jgi:hypothetical protein